MIISNHAAIRLNQRCSLKPYEVRQILLNGCYTPLGINDYSNREHQLIYSEKDDECFVVIQDANDKNVITVLPVYYHRSWEISPEALKLAERAYYGNKAYEEKRRQINQARKEEQKEIEKEIRKAHLENRSVKTISILAHKVTVESRCREYDKKILTTKKNKDFKICTFAATDLVSAGFPSNAEINKEAVITELSNNTQFIGNIAKFVQKAITTKSLDVSGVKKYSMVLHEKSQQFEISLQKII